MPSLHDVATWQPLLRLLHAAHADTLSAPGGHVAGQIGTGGWSVPLPYRPPQPGRAALISDNQEEFDAIGLIVEALKEEGSDGISFVVEAASAPGRVRLHLIEPSPSVEPGVATAHPGRLLLADGALPEPVRRLPEPVPGAAPAASADVDLLRRTLRERLPDAVGASEEELAAAEARLGVTLPPELRALYEVVRSRYEDCDDSREPYDVIGCDLFPLSEVYIADAASRQVLWQFGAMDAVETGPEHAVQQLVGSPGWIVFGDNGGGDRIAVDLTPGPDGHVGQVIIIGHEGNIGAGLVADSLTDMVVHRHFDGRPVRKVEQPPLVAYVNRASLPSVEAASHPGLEVLSIGVWEKEPVSLAPGLRPAAPADLERVFGYARRPVRDSPAHPPRVPGTPARGMARPARRGGRAQGTPGSGHRRPQATGQPAAHHRPRQRDPHPVRPAADHGNHGAGGGGLLRRAASESVRTDGDS